MEDSSQSPHEFLLQLGRPGRGPTKSISPHVTDLARNIQMLNSHQVDKSKSRKNMLNISIHPWHFFGWQTIPERKLEIISICYMPTFSHLAVLQLHQVNSFVPLLLQSTSTLLFTPPGQTPWQNQGDVILPSTPAWRQTDLSPVSPSGIARFISCESLVFQFSIILRITKRHSFAEEQDFIHIMYVKQTLKSSFFRSCIFPAWLFFTQ